MVFAVFSRLAIVNKGADSLLVIIFHAVSHLANVQSVFSVLQHFFRASFVPGS